MNRKLFHIKYLAIFFAFISFALISCKKEKPLEPNEEAAKRQTPNDTGEDDYYSGKGNIQYFQAIDSVNTEVATKEEE